MAEHPEDVEIEKLKVEKTRTELELEVDRLRLERARMFAELQKLSSPWWKSWSIASLGALLTAIAPATAAVQGYFQKEKELALENRKQEHTVEMDRLRQNEQIRTAYLDRLQDPGARLRTLRFLRETSQDSDIKRWASQEAILVQEEITKLEAERQQMLAAAQIARDRQEKALITAGNRAELAKFYGQDAADKTANAKAIDFKIPASALTGQIASAQRLSARLRALMKERLACPNSSDPDKCFAKVMAVLARGPTDADIAHIEELESRAASDAAAAKELLQLRLVFIRNPEN